MMKNNELLQYIAQTWEGLKDDGLSKMIKVEGSRAPIFLRVSNQKVAFLLTVDVNREPDIKPKKFNNVSIQIEKMSQSTKAIVVTLTNARFMDIFIKIAADVIGYTMTLDNDFEQIALFCAKVNSWKNLFSRGVNEALTPEEQLGLYGELTLLKALINEGFPTVDVINSWKGADAEDKDFQFKNIGIEVKSSIKQDKIVKISNIRQLDPAGYDDLYLYYFAFVKSNGGPDTLPILIDEIRSLLTGSPLLDEFEAKLMNTGYNDSDRDMYASSYTNVTEDAYHVSSDFPMISRNLVADAILDASYLVDLNACDQFNITYNDFIKTIKNA